MRERGDFCVNTQLGRDEWGDCEEKEQRGACYGNGGPDVVPPHGVRLFGWCFLATFFLGAMIFFGLRVNWFAPIGLLFCVGVCLLPSTVEFLCRGNKVLKRDRSSFFWW